MFYCERCGTNFNAAAGAAQVCPRCRAEGIYSPLTFKLFDPAVTRGIGGTTRREAARSEKRRRVNHG